MEHRQTPGLTWPRSLASNCIAALRDTRGAVVIEAALVLPFLILLMLGIMTYSQWFMAEHSVQQAANDAARAALAGLTESERDGIVNDSLAHSVLHAGTVDPHLLSVQTGLDGAYYTVSVSYDAQASSLYRNSLFPLPARTIRRTATVQLTSL